MRLRIPIRLRSRTAPVDPGEPHLTGLDGGNDDRGGLNVIAKLVREHAQLLVEGLTLPVRDGEIALASEFGDGIGDRVVEAAIERLEFFHCDRHASLRGELRYGLAQIAIVVHDLVDGEPVP